MFLEIQYSILRTSCMKDPGVSMREKLKHYFVDDDKRFAESDKI
jgi:hypothetical protein